MIKLVLFDWDQTLIHSYDVVESWYNHLHKDLKYNIDGMDMQWIFSSTTAECDAKLMQNNPGLTREKLKEFDTEFVKQYYAQKIYGLPLVYWLKRQSIKVGIVTNADKRSVLAMLKEKKKLFDVLLSFEDANDGQSKKGRMITSLQKYGLKPYEAMYIGDHVNDIRYAKEAGVVAVGYVNKTYTKKELEKENPAYIIQGIEDVRKIVKKINSAGKK
jgi:HAD superfamily hydrolase (TIGR01549 family)